MSEQGERGVARVRQTVRRLNLYWLGFSVAILVGYLSGALWAYGNGYVGEFALLVGAGIVSAAFATAVVTVVGIAWRGSRAI